MTRVTSPQPRINPRLSPSLLTSLRNMLRFDHEASVYHMSWDYHVIMMSLVPDYSTTFHTTSHSDSYYYED
jgi:hypothetical protein